MNYLSNATLFASLSNFNTINNTTGGVLIYNLIKIQHFSCRYFQIMANYVPCHAVATTFI